MNTYNRNFYALPIILSCVSCGSFVGPVERSGGPFGVFVMKSMGSEGKTQVVSKSSFLFQDPHVATDFVRGSYEWGAGEASFLIVAKVEGLSLTTDSNVVDVLGVSRHSRTATGNVDRKPAATTYEVLAVRLDSKNESRVWKLDGFENMNKQTSQSFKVMGFLGQMGYRQHIDGRDEEKDRELPTIMNRAERLALEVNEKYLLTILFDRDYAKRFTFRLKIIDSDGQMIEREFVCSEG